MKALMALIFTALLLPSVQHPVLQTVRNTNTATDLWVDAAAGNDANNGRSADSAFSSIQAAAQTAVPGTTVHILPGIYRESVTPASDGTASAPITFKAEAGPGTVQLRGSIPATSLKWKRMLSDDIGLPASVDPTTVYFADLSGWGLTQPPRFIVRLNQAGEVVARLMPAREPDWRADEDWKDTEFWWMANGGSTEAGCDPTTDADPHCDKPWRSFNQLTDTSSDTDPAGIEPGNLMTLGNLTGATLIALDAQHGHYTYHRTIVAHDPAAGLIRLAEDCDNDGNPALGWGSKYYIENHPGLLDQPGEWWFDSKRGRLYLWPPSAQDPASLDLEISRLDVGFDLTNRSYITLDGLTIEFFNQRAYTIWNDDGRSRAYGNAIRNSILRYANEGVSLYQYTNNKSPDGFAIDGFTLEDSEVAYMDTSGFDSSFWWPNAPSPAQFVRSTVRNIVIRNNELHHLGFNSDARSPVGIRVFFPDQLRFEGNHVYHVAHSGAQFHLSLIDSTREYGFEPQEIMLGNILIANNIFEDTCLRASDCGALKLGGSHRPTTHVFRDVLITGNVFRNTVGWSYVSARRGVTRLGDGNGLYIDYASGFHVYRNIAYNNTGAGFKLSCLWVDGDMILYNNIAANNFTYGFKLTNGSDCDDHNGSVNTQLANNIIINNAAGAMQLESHYETANFGDLVIDHNLYFLNGWSRESENGDSTVNILLYQGERDSQWFRTLEELRAKTPWEVHGLEGGPGFLNYDPADHDVFDGSWPDFHVPAPGANVMERGTAELPASLSSLLSQFGIADARLGPAYEIGAFEMPPLPPTPSLQPTPKPTRPAGSTCWPLPAAFILAPFALHRLRTRQRPRSTEHEDHLQGRPS